MPLKECPLIPANLGTKVSLILKGQPIDQIIEQDMTIKQLNLKLGGRYEPPYCLSRHQMAIIVPFRDREKNLELFLLNMHPFLAKQEYEKVCTF